jgi:hypothetical protein
MQLPDEVQENREGWGPGHHPLDLSEMQKLEDNP